MGVVCKDPKVGTRLQFLNLEIPSLGYLKTDIWEVLPPGEYPSAPDGELHEFKAYDGTVVVRNLRTNHVDGISLDGAVPAPSMQCAQCDKSLEPNIVDYLCSTCRKTL